MHDLKETVYKFFRKNIAKEEEFNEESKEHKRIYRAKKTFIENESFQKELLSGI